MLHVGSLFSGAGLCDLGFHQAGFKHRFFCEIDPYCRAVLARHWPGVPLYTDIRMLQAADLPKIDLLSGGFPCQDVSCSPKEWKSSYQTFPPLGTMRNGYVCRRPRLERLTVEKECSLLPTPTGSGPAGEHGLFAPLATELGEYKQPGVFANWLGIRIDRSSREAIRKAYGEPVLHRVDDGSPQRLDQPRGQEPGWGVTPINEEQRRAMLPMLKALGNGITPRQSYAVARCILRAEGLI